MIIDAGVICGSSTLCFGGEIIANPDGGATFARRKKQVHTYEYGIVNSGMIPFFQFHGVKKDWKVA
jgi:hypothetical protein